MRRVVGAALWCGVALVAVSAISTNQDDQVLAAGDSSTGATIDVSASVAGRYATPAGVWEDPCGEGQVFRSNAALNLPVGGGAIGTERVADDRVVERAWATYCEDIDTGSLLPGTLNIFWIGVPDPVDLVPTVFANVADYLDPPVVEWPNMSPEHGWLFVKVPMDFRVRNLAPVTVTASATNVLGTATASVTATPNEVSFDSGEGGGTACGFADAMAGYAPGAAGACSYTYQNSSAIAGGAFGTTTTVQWDITSNPVSGTIPTSLDTSTSEGLAVSEVQAVVTCQGSGC